MPPRLELACIVDAEAIAALRNTVAEDLTHRHGKGWWSGGCTGKGVIFDMRHARVYVARQQGALVATLRLATKKPWAIDRSYFTPCKRPLYLTSMAVAPGLQRQGLGRTCIAEASDLALGWPADAIYLDAFHDTAGAGEFYRKCGFREVGRVVYRRVPLIYFELLLPQASSVS